MIRSILLLLLAGFGLLMLIGVFNQNPFSPERWKKELSQHFKELEAVFYGRIAEMSTASEDLEESLINEIFQDTASRSRVLTNQQIKQKIAEIELWHQKELEKLTKQQWRRSKVRNMQEQHQLSNNYERGWLLKDIQEDFSQTEEIFEEWWSLLSQIVEYQHENSGSWGFVKAFATGALSGVEMTGGALALSSGNLGGIGFLNSGGQRFLSLMNGGGQIKKQFAQSCEALDESIRVLAIRIGEVLVARLEEHKEEVLTLISQLENQMLQTQADQKTLRSQSLETEDTSASKSEHTAKDNLKSISV